MVGVRPPVRRLLRVVLPIVIVVAAWQVWDNVEAGRLRRAIAQFGPDERRQPFVPDGGAARLYAAAAIASADLRASSVPAGSEIDVIRRRREVMIADGTPAPEDVELWDMVLARAALPAMLIEQAASLTFTAFAPGTAFDYRASGLINASRLAEAGTLTALGQRDGESAFRSIRGRIQFLRAFDDDGFLQDQRARLGQDIAADLSLALSGGQLSRAQLGALDEALAPLHSDDDLPRALNALAHRQFGFVTAATRAGQYSVIGRVFTPWLRRSAVHQLEPVAEALRVSKQGWPDLLRGLAQIEDSSAAFSVRVIAHRIGVGVASFGATIRTTRAALAVERYRGEHRRLPGSLNELALPVDDIEDPFSGEPIKYVVAADGFAVYSVGADGRDDGGHFESERAKGRAPGVGPLFDIGVRIKPPGRR
jgi:hypothetical protein